MTSSLDQQALEDLLSRPNLRHLLDVLNGGGEETRIVGGAVRNALLGRKVSDVDLATTATPDVVTERTARAGLKPVPTGIEHGTVTVVSHGEPFEVTTLRKDVETDGRRAVVRFGRDFKADAQRRDFTINALFLGRDGRLHDYTEGLADLSARRLRFIGDPRTRIREDYLRILRFFRFHAEYAESAPDPEGLAAAVSERAGLGGLSHERIRTELLKLLVARRAVVTVELMGEHGLLTLLLGGVAEFGRLYRVVAFEADLGMAPDPVRRLAALAVMTWEDAERLRERLRLSNEEFDRLMRYADRVAELKTRPMPLDAIAIRCLVAEHGVGPSVDVLAAVSGEPAPVVLDEARAALERFRTGAEPIPVFPLRGADFVGRGVAKGPKVGELLELARQAWLAAGCPADSAYARTLLERTLDRVAP